MILHCVHSSKSFVPFLSHRHPFHPVPSRGFKVHSNIIFQFMLMSYRDLLSFSFPHQNTAYMPHPPHFPDLTWPDLTCFIHKSHHWPRLMYLFPLPCDAGLFAVKLSLCIRMQLNCKIRNMLWPESEEIAGKRKTAGWRDSWFAVRFYYYLADQMIKNRRAASEIYRQKESTYTILKENMCERKHLGDFVVDMRIILKQILKK